MVQHSPSIFVLGATGYVGSELLILLNRDFPDFPVIALVRPASLSQVPLLHKIHKNVTIIEGTLDDEIIIQEQAAKADIVINVASSDHLRSIQATLAGLEQNSASRPDNPPLYLHVSGTGIISDNARGEPVEDVREWSDIGLNLRECPAENMHLEQDILVMDAGTRKNNPVRTIILLPAQIYGVGEGIQPTTLWLRIFLDLTMKLGYAGTWGPGANSMNNVHVKDVASALLIVFQAALEGRAAEGAEGLYFVASMENRISYREWTKVMGDYLYKEGIIKESGTRPMPAEVVDPLGHYGWSLLGGNQFSKPDRLTQLGWEPVETKKISLLDYIPLGIDTAVLQMQVKNPPT